MARTRSDGNAAYDLYRNPWNESTARELELPELPELPQQRPADRERVVVKARAEISVTAVLGFVAVLALLVMVISGYVRLYELSSDHADLADELTALQAEQDRLEASYESKLDMEQIETVAASELGMHVPGADQIVYLDMSGEDAAVVYDSDSMGVSSVFQALQNGFRYLTEYIRAYFS